MASERKGNQQPLLGLDSDVRMRVGEGKSDSEPVPGMRLISLRTV